MHETPRTYRRTITVTVAAAAAQPTRVRAELSDTHHRMSIDVEHERGVIRAVAPQGQRLPWSTCAVGLRGAQRLVGLTLEEASRLRVWAADRSGHCTHMLDLALLAVGHAYGPAESRYELGVSPPAGRLRRAWIRLDGRPVLDWRLDGSAITGPDPWTGLDLDARPLPPRLGADIPPGVREAAFMLRRACHIGQGDAVDLDTYRVAAQIGVLEGTCHTLQPVVAQHAHRMRGSSRPSREA
jgi:Protein of unknown function (DUF2889)